MPDFPDLDQTAAYRDLAREMLAYSEAELRDYCLSVAADRDAYQELLKYALSGWHATLDERDALRRRNRQLDKQLRDLVGVAR